MVERSGQRRSTVGVLAVAGVAVAALLVGGLMTAKSIGGAPVPTAPLSKPRPKELVPPVQGRKPPSAFGLPTYPGSIEFTSLSSPSGLGSSAFYVKTGKPAAVVRHYVKELGKGGWDLVWERKATVRPAGDPSAHTRIGRRARWGSPKRHKQLTLLVLENPIRGGVDAVLSWAPMEVIDEAQVK
jgi:hypothetical protein